MGSAKPLQSWVKRSPETSIRSDRSGGEYLFCATFEQPASNSNRNQTSCCKFLFACVVLIAHYEHFFSPLPICLLRLPTRPRPCRKNRVQTPITAIRTQFDVIFRLISSSATVARRPLDSAFETWGLRRRPVCRCETPSMVPCEAYLESRDEKRKLASFLPFYRS